MAKVYILWESKYPEDGIVGIFSSEHKARAAWYTRPARLLFPDAEPPIEEVEVDLIEW